MRIRNRMVRFNNPDHMHADSLQGKTGEVVSISRESTETCGFSIMVKLDDPSGTPVPSINPQRHHSDDFMPVDVEQIPESHRGHPNAVNAWFFCSLRDDFYPPVDV